MAQVGQGVVYVNDSRGRPLRKASSPGEREQLLSRFYRPYHQAVKREVEQMLSLFGKCLVLGCHSFSSTPLPLEPDQDPHRPDICLGTDSVHTPERLTAALYVRAGP